jgi:tail protein P2 I
VTVSSERLYNLMPAIYRIRDLAVGQTLRAYMAVLESVYAMIQGDIDQLYDDWFIETCQERMVPYIADLVDVEQLLDTWHIQGTRRRHIANITTYRRITGTLETIEDIARDLTGWPVHAVDMAGLVSATEHTRFPRTRRGTLIDVRQRRPVAGLDDDTHGLDVRHTLPDSPAQAVRPAGVQAHYNLSDVALFVWRLQTYPVAGSTPARIAAGRYTFDPTGADVPLFQPARTPPRTRDGALEAFLPRPIDSDSGAGAFPFEVTLAGANMPVESSAIRLADLSQWQPTQAAVTVDPRLGRIACGVHQEVASVSYWYAFSGDVGAGPYSRQDSIQERLNSRSITWYALVSHTIAADPEKQVFSSLTDAVTAWNNLPPGQSGVIAIIDNATYDAPAQPVVLASRSFLALVAARCVAAPCQSADSLIATGIRPCVRGALAVVGTGHGAEPGDLLIDGFLWDGSVEVQPGNFGQLEVRHCSLVPARGGIHAASNPRLRLILDGSICGRLDVDEPDSHVMLIHTIVDGRGDRSAVDAPGAMLEVRASTILGRTRAGVVDASDSLFDGRLDVHRQQAGGIAYSFVPAGSRTPGRHRCQPDLGLGQATPDERDWILARLVPSFTSVHFGDAGYAQLTPGTPSEIRAGANSDGEMGAFYVLYQPVRMTHFLSSLRDFLPAGRDVDVLFMS